MILFSCFSLNSKNSNIVEYYYYKMRRNGELRVNIQVVTGAVTLRVSCLHMCASVDMEEKQGNTQSSLRRVYVPSLLNWPMR